MPCSPFPRVAACAFVIFRVCGAYRPNGDETQQLAVIPKGFMFVAEGKVGGNGPEIQRLLLQRAEDSDTTWSHTLQEASPFNHNGTQASGLQQGMRKPSSLEQSAAMSDFMPNISKSGKPSCQASGNGGGNKSKGDNSAWKCDEKGIFHSVIHDGKKCTVVCEDDFNREPKTKELTCNGEAGDYYNGGSQEDPECIKRKQCPVRGPGWKCKAVGKIDAVNIDAKCLAECDECEGKEEKDCAWKASVPESHCKAGSEDGEWDPEPQCEEKQHCESKTDDFQCEGHEDGREPVKSGQPCNVKCTEPKFVPSQASVTCHDGQFTPKPTCGEAPPPPKPAAGKNGAPRHCGPKLVITTLTTALAIIVALAF